jgi:hypothetical protein
LIFLSLGDAVYGVDPPALYLAIEIPEINYKILGLRPPPVMALLIRR